MTPARTRTRRPRRFAALAAVATLVAGVTITALAPAAQAAAPPLVSAQSGRGLDVNGNDATPGAELHKDQAMSEVLIAGARPSHIAGLV